MSGVEDARATIVALSSGALPAGIAIVRVSGPRAADALRALTGSLPQPRRTNLRELRDGQGNLLDRALVIWFPGPATATGEDCAEFHCHGGRAVVGAVQEAIIALPDCRAAQAGEFTRRAFANGRMDLLEAEGLSDLLAAETELQRRAAIANAGGVVSARVAEWRDEVLRLSAQIEAALDFSDEDDVDELPKSFTWNITQVTDALRQWVDRPRAEKLGEGFRIVLSGPPNSGKSTLFNALVESEAAITSPIAGTTRDVIERSVGIGGVPFTFVDTAGLHEGGNDAIEAIGIERARNELDRADVVLWLGAEGLGPGGSWEIAARIDAGDCDYQGKLNARHAISAITGEGMDTLKRDLVDEVRGTLPRPGEGVLNARQHSILVDALEALERVIGHRDLLLVGEELRTVRLAFDRLIGRSTTEDMLDALFGRFCIGK